MQPDSAVAAAAKIKARPKTDQRRMRGDDMANSLF